MSSIEHEYVLSGREQLEVFLSNECRPDGREFEQIRHVEISPDTPSSSCYGSATVKWGKTVISCSVNVQIGIPSVDCPSHGSIVFDVALWPICSSKYDVPHNRKSSEALNIESVLEKLYSDSSAFDMNQLCIEKGKSAYALTVQAVCLSNDGGLIESIMLATSVALSRTVLPAFCLDAESRVCVSSPSESHMDISCASATLNKKSAKMKDFQRSKCLKMKKRFIALTTGALSMNKKNVVLFDPSEQENQKEILDGKLLVIIDTEGNICHSEFSSNGVASPYYVHLCASTAERAHNHFMPLLCH